MSGLTTAVLYHLNHFRTSDRISATWAVMGAQLPAGSVPGILCRLQRAAFGPPSPSSDLSLRQGVRILTSMPLGILRHLKTSMLVLQAEHKHPDAPLSHARGGIRVFWRFAVPPPMHFRLSTSSLVRETTDKREPEITATSRPGRGDLQHRGGPTGYFGRLISSTPPSNNSRSPANFLLAPGRWWGSGSRVLAVSNDGPSTSRFNFNQVVLDSQAGC